jgi:deoxycytidylate deaminase
VKLLLQKGISEIIYLSDKHHNDPPYIAARKLLEAANIKVRQYNGEILL